MPKNEILINWENVSRSNEVVTPTKTFPLTTYEPHGELYVKRKVMGKVRVVCFGGRGVGKGGFVRLLVGGVLRGGRLDLRGEGVG